LQAESQINLQTQSLIDYIRVHKEANFLIPNVVAAVASLTIQDDFGIPIELAPHHWLWLDLLCDDRIKKLMIIAPPDSAKTTISIAFLSTYIGFYPEHNCIIASVSDDVAEQRSLSLRNIIIAPSWKAIFPSILPAERMKWEQSNWSLAPNGMAKPGRIHPTVSSYGTGASITGSRADIILGDDILDNDNTRTFHQRKLVKEWIHNSFLPRRKANGRVILIGTSWHSEDAYNDIRKSRHGWVICHMPSLSERDDGYYVDIFYPDNFKGKMLGSPVGGAS
jgi:hypothetical protein